MHGKTSGYRWAKTRQQGAFQVVFWYLCECVLESTVSVISEKRMGHQLQRETEGADLLTYAAEKGMDTYEKAKDDTEKYGKISVDIMENVENNFTEARTSGELARGRMKMPFVVCRIVWE